LETNRSGGETGREQVGQWKRTVTWIGEDDGYKGKKDRDGQADIRLL
jgi:hypothetical protein